MRKKELEKQKYKKKKQQNNQFFTISSCSALNFVKASSVSLAFVNDFFENKKKKNHKINQFFLKK